MYSLYTTFSLFPNNDFCVFPRFPRFRRIDLALHCKAHEREVYNKERVLPVTTSSSLSSYTSEAKQNCDEEMLKQLSKGVFIFMMGRRSEDLSNQKIVKHFVPQNFQIYLSCPTIKFKIRTGRNGWIVKLRNIYQNS